MKILDTAKEAGIHFADGTVTIVTPKSITKFAELLLAQERERCAKLLDYIESNFHVLGFTKDTKGFFMLGTNIRAKDIREAIDKARGE